METEGSIDRSDGAEAARGPVAPVPAELPRRAIRRLFVANRGEIARRIERTCRRLGIVAILPERDLVPGGAGRSALDLLDVAAVVAAARGAGADAVHPGYGFLAESAAFAAAVESAGLTWVGPPPGAIEAMGDKAAARRLAAALGVPVLPGYDGADQSDSRLTAEATRIGYPLLIKPAAGGGGKGMREVRDPARLDEGLAAARREALGAFADDRLILERLLVGPRHVEIQVLFDGYGAGVHLGERDCSYQRRHQKVLEESPSPAVGADLRARLGEAALTLARAVGYRSAGTVEFLVAGDPPGEFFFLEMNTRLQVEHPVTEFVTGRDLVGDQLRIASGEPLGITQEDVHLRGQAVEVRLYAEDPDSGFLPSTGTILRLDWPSGDGVRVDAGVDPGSEVGGRFDPMLAKLIACGETRDEALDRLIRALDETVVLGLRTNLGFLRWLARREETRAGAARVDTLERIWQPGGEPEPPDAAWQAAARNLAGNAADDPWRGGWRLNAPPAIRLAAGSIERTVRPDRDGGSGLPAAVAGDEAHVSVDGRDVAFRLAPPPEVLAAARAAARHGATGATPVEAPMPGAVLAVAVRPGQTVEAGEPIVTLGAMKMEHAVPAPQPGRIAEVLVAAGDQVTRGQVVAVIEPPADPAAPAAGPAARPERDVRGGRDG